MGFFKRIVRRKRPSRAAHPRAAEQSAYLDSFAPSSDEGSSDDAVRRISQSVEVLKRLSTLKQEVEATQVDLTEEGSGVTGPPSVPADPDPPSPTEEVVARVEDRSSTGWRPIGASRGEGGSFQMTTVTEQGPTATKPEPVAHRFRSAASIDPGITTGDADSSMGQRDLRSKIGQVFSPSAPVSRRDLFAGRTQQMEDLVDTVYESGQHAVIYGERGVGKTSLAATIGLILDQTGTAVVRINCDGADNFTTIWQKILTEIQIGGGVPAGDAALAVLSDVSGKEKIAPNDVRHALQAIAGYGEAVIFIDEFDTVRDPSVHGLFADTIKTLSDQLVPSTLVIIGVADNLDELLAEHGSVRRALAQIHMPRMSQTELAEIVGRGLRFLGMACEGAALTRLTQLSQGFPYYTKLLARTATRAAVEEGRSGISVMDVQLAVAKVVGRVDETIRGLYNQAVHGDDEELHGHALRAAAFAPRDERGYFRALDALGTWGATGPTNVDLEMAAAELDELTDPVRGPALEERTTQRGRRYRFSDPLLQPYVLMKGFVSGDIDALSLDQLAFRSQLSTTKRVAPQ